MDEMALMQAAALMLAAERGLVVPDGETAQVAVDEESETMVVSAGGESISLTFDEVAQAAANLEAVAPEVVEAPASEDEMPEAAE